VVTRFFAGLFLVSISFAVVFGISFLVALLVGASAVRAAVVGGACAASRPRSLLNAIIVIGRRTEAQHRGRFDDGDAGSAADTDRRSR
jgi:hypothetical protein